MVMLGFCSDTLTCLFVCRWQNTLPSQSILWKVSDRTGIMLLTKNVDTIRKFWSARSRDITPDLVFHFNRTSEEALCRALSASCLVRVGKDEDAVNAYDLALELKDCLDANTQQDLILGKAQALQRRLRYDEAKNQYLQSFSECGAVEAVTCALRLGETEMSIPKIRGLDLSWAEIAGWLKSTGFLVSVSD
jgi:hypothetical protein